MSSMATATATLPLDRAGLSPRTMYFPPPPAYAAQPPGKENNAKRNISIPFTFSFKAQTQSQPQTYLNSHPRPNTASSSSSTNSNPTLQKPPRPILKKSIGSTKRTRQWILLSLLLVSFTILILSVIFAYCAALPHSDNIADAQASQAAVADGFDGPVTSTVSVFAVSTSASNAVTATTTATPTPTPIPVSNNPTQPQTDTYPTIRRFKRTPQPLLPIPRDTPTSAITTPIHEMTQEEIDAALSRDAENQSRFSTTHAQVALTFYTATLPLLTILHTAVELLVSLVRPETSQNTKMGELLLLRGRGGVTAVGSAAVSASASASAAADRVLRRRRIGALLSFSASALLLLGWTVMQLFTLNCEIVTFGSGGEGVCPVQIRGHRMGGISELSVGKVVLGFSVVVGYCGYCGFLVRRVGVVGGGRKVETGRVGSFKRRARFASRDGGKEMGDVENIGVGVEGRNVREGGA